MKLRDIVIAVVIIGIVGFILYNISTSDNTPQLEASPTPSAAESSLEDRFGRDIPENVDKAELSGQVAGEQVNAIATRTYENGMYMTTVLADLGNPLVGKSYHAWIAKGDEVVYLGRMQPAKGGWLLDYDAAKDYSTFNHVIISEEASVGTKPATIVLEGNF